MKSIVSRIPRKLLLILSGVTVLGGGSGAAAVYIGADKLLGPSYSALNGLSCTTVETIRIKKADRYWVRKYVTMDKPGDGMSRLKTALRVARKVQEAERSDLVQVTVLDPAGPTDRSRMRGRAIGAQVVYIPDTSKVPDGHPAQPVTAYYVDGAADANGDFWGMRIDMPREDAEHLTAALTDDTDCLDALGQGAGEPGPLKADDKSAGHGEAVGGHDAEKQGGPADTPAEVPVASDGTEAEQGLLASLMGMVGLGAADPVAETSASSHDLPPDDLPDPAHSATGGDIEKPDAAPGADEKAEAGWLDTVKGMVGFGETKAEPEAPEVPAEKESAAAPAQEEKPSPPAAAESAGKPAETGAQNHGAAWLARMRAQPMAPEKHEAPDVVEKAAAAEAVPVSVVAEEDDPEKHRRKREPAKAP